MKPTSRLRILFLLGLLLLPAAAHAASKNIQVHPVIISDVPKPSWTEIQWQYIDHDFFTKAIVDTLDHSGLFSTVGISGPADYRLSAEVVGQKMVGSMSNIMLLLVRYQLVDTPSGNMLWSENLLTFHHLSASDVFMGGTRAAQVVETAIRKNLQQLVARLDEYTSGEQKVLSDEPKRLNYQTQPKIIDKKPEDDVGYPHKLTGDEIKEHYQRNNNFIFDRVPRSDFTLKILSFNNIERDCDMCNVYTGSGVMNIKESQNQVCFDWDDVSYPSSTCFDVIQIEDNRYQLIDPTDGETYGYKVLQ